jgi:hypothetical protein
MPYGFLTEAGPRPYFADAFGADALASAAYPDRTLANVKAADAIFWFGSIDSPGCRATLGACRATGRPVRVISLEGPTVRPSVDVRWLQRHHVGVLNISGNRESSEPGIGQRTEAFLGRVFRLATKSGDGAVEG